MSIRKKINRLIIRLIVPILLLMNLGCDSVPEEGDTVIAWVYAIEDTKEGRF